ncbi:MAG: AAA family ATPase [Sideroxydans sp.]|nr:AAA family ATPase [Sideroxydans sp.]
MTDYPAQQKLVAALLDPRHYPHAAKNVRLLETHISWVLLAGRYAYKIKKSIDLGFLDFTSLPARQRYCAEEIRLNRRLAPRIYLDVVAISGTADRPQLAQSGTAIEYAVKMRRFAAGSLLDRQLMRGRLTPQHIDRLAATLASFHAKLPSAAAQTPYGTPASIGAAALQNFEQLQTLLHDADDLHALATARQICTSEYAVCERIFAQRRTQGFVRECHGDLHLGNIALIGGEPVPFDGIEFNPGLRWIDVINDIAFLYMDLLFHGQPALAFRFLNAWLESTGDYAGVAVLRFYCTYRTMVRAKVNAILADQPGLPKRTSRNAMAACRNYLSLAIQCQKQAHPALIITHGLPGSGKTTFAQAALEKFQAIRIRSDVERKRLFGLPAHADSHAAGSDIYSKQAGARTYAQLLALAQQLLAAGYPVIVDAAFLKRVERKLFRALARQMQVPFAIASLHAATATLHTRITRRQTLANDASEADLKVLEKLQAIQEPLAGEELEHAVRFVNEHEADYTCMPAWHDLETLLGHIKSS